MRLVQIWSTTYLPATQKGVDASSRYGILVRMKFILKKVRALSRDCLIGMLLAALLAVGVAGCSSAPVLPPEQGAPTAPMRPENNTDQARLKDALTGQEMPPGEVADLSDRILDKIDDIAERQHYV